MKLRIKIEGFYNSTIANNKILEQNEVLNLQVEEGFQYSDNWYNIAEMIKRDVMLSLRAMTIEQLCHGYSKYGEEYKSSQIKDSKIYIRITSNNFPDFKAGSGITNALLYESYVDASIFKIPFTNIKVNDVDGIMADSYSDNMLDGGNLFAY